MTTTDPSQTLKMSRVIKAPRERIYNAFLDPDQLAKWMPPSGYTGRIDRLEPHIGGSWHGSFTSIDKKESHSFGGKYLELVPHERIVHTDRFDTDHPGMKDEMKVTVTLEEVPEGTRVTIVQENIPKAIPLEDARTGWTSTLENLARLVEF